MVKINVRLPIKIILKINQLLLTIGKRAASPVTFFQFLVSLLIYFNFLSSKSKENVERALSNDLIVKPNIKELLKLICLEFIS